METWVGEHPFINGDTGGSSAVFQAVIGARALKNDVARSEALRKELAKGDAANPFLYVFYMGEEPGSEATLLPGEHIGVIYSSIRASLAQGETAGLLVEDADDQESSIADVEIEVSRRGNNTWDLLSFRTKPFGTICLGPHVRDVVIRMPHANVEVGQGTEVTFVAPVDIECAALAIMADKVIVENTPESLTPSVFLQADSVSASSVATAPGVRNKARLFVSWPNADNYPWTSFAIEPSRGAE